MSEITLRQIAGRVQAAWALAPPKTGEMSLLRDFFGYTSPPPTSGPAAVEATSVQRQVSRLRGLYIDLNLLTVGVEATLDLPAVHRGLDIAVAAARETFASVGLGIGRIERWWFSVEDAGGFDEISSNDEASELWESFSYPQENGAIDVFVVRSLHVAGRSPVDGACDHSGKDTGLVILFAGGALGIGATLAHEIGHYLCLAHAKEHAEDENDPAATDPFNIMNEPAPSHGTFTTKQGEIMRHHCMVRPPCL